MPYYNLCHNFKDFIDSMQYDKPDSNSILISISVTNILPAESIDTLVNWMQKSEKLPMNKRRNEFLEISFPEGVKVMVEEIIKIVLNGKTKHMQTLKGCQ